jgi:excinuclease ABC subunit C
VYSEERPTLVKDPERLETILKELPLEPGVYFMKDARDQILYIGKSKKLRNRVRSYFRDTHRHMPRTAIMVMQIVDIEFIVTDTEAEALALEANLIKQHQPHFNVLLKDDKKYPYLCITWSEDYPRIFVTRKRRKNLKDRYYGPYVDAGLLRRTLSIAKRTFPLRQRPQPLFKDRPCLNYDIGRCPGVCQELISLRTITRRYSGWRWYSRGAPMSWRRFSPSKWKKLLKNYGLSRLPRFGISCKGWNG